MPAARTFATNLASGARGEAVTELQTVLATLGFYTGLEDGAYSAAVERAVLSFQLEAFVIDSADATGAGRFGPQTREALSLALTKHETQLALQKRWDDFHFDGNLAKGKRSEAVLKLQEILVQRELLEHQPTGYFGKLTKAALIEFQLQEGLISHASAPGAGTVGPQTRERRNQRRGAEKDALAADAQAQRAFVLEQNDLKALAGLDFQPLDNRITKH